MYLSLTILQEETWQVYNYKAELILAFTVTLPPFRQ